MKQFNMFLLLFFFLKSAFGEGGSVDILVSDKGLPLKNFTVIIDNNKLITDEMGFASIDIKAGEHQLFIENDGEKKVIPFIIVEKERTQMIINLMDDEQVLHETAEPIAQEVVVIDENQEFGEMDLTLFSVKGEPLSGVRIFAKGVITSDSSDRAGRIKIKLPIGTSLISLTHPKYSTQVLRDIKIEKNKTLVKRVELTPSGLVLEDFVVLAPNLKGSIQALIEVRRKASDLADVMSAEQMAKTGDSDAAGSLKRVTGLTLKDGKYVYVRGLGERYSSTLLNGINLPSPDPSRRVIPLDLFPIQFLDNMIIQKSYSPNQPGEFGGGVVMLQTKAMPEKFFTKISLSQSQNSNDGDLKSYKGSKTDWLGLDDGSRKLPFSILDKDTDLKQLTQVLPGSAENQQNETLPDLSLSVGNSYKLRTLQLGFTVSGLYKDDISYIEQDRGRYRQENGLLVQEDDIVREKTQKEKVLGGIAGVQLKLFKDHQISANFIKLINTTDYVEVLQGRNAEGNTFRQTGFEFATRTLDTLLFQGENKIKALNDVKLDWHLAQSKARRNEPRRLRVKYSPNKQGTYTYNVDQGLELRYYDLQEKADDVGASINVPYPWFYKRKASLDLGVNRTQKKRNSNMVRFGLENVSPCAGNLSQDVASILSECPDSFAFFNGTQPTDNYLAQQTIDAYYFKNNWPLLKNLEFTTGMRFESSIQNVETVSPFEKQAIMTQLQTKDWLPGSTLTWKLNKKMQMRLAFSETISRPDLRELSNTLWQDFETGYDVQGNPNLSATVIESYDYRWEWYFTQKENVSIGLFYKDFKNPIEQVFTAGSDSRISFFNVDSADIYGAEFELSKNLRFLTSYLRRFTVSGNYAFILSDVKLGNIQNSESSESNRPLQGQSNYTANFLLDYEYEPSQMNASLAYNVYGKRIAYTAPEGLPNIWELPFHQLDLVLSKSFSRNFKVNMKVKNLLNSRMRLFQGGQEWQGWNVGQTYSIGLSAEI